MAYIDNQLKSFKDMIEDAIITGGVAGKTSCIRSSALINLIHDAVKWELIEHYVFRRIRTYILGGNHGTHPCQDRCGCTPCPLQRTL